MIERDEFIAANLGLVHSCCHRLTGRGIEYDDLYGAGCIGLIKAYDGFDKSRGFAFSTYAVPVILGEIRRLFRDGGTVKVSRTLKELSLRATRERERLTKELGYDPSISELAERLFVTSEELTEALTASLPVISLTYESDDGVQELDLPSCEIETQISEGLALKEVVGSLAPVDRNLIELRYFSARTQSETAQALGMTQVQVSRRERVILGELRKMLLG